MIGFLVALFIALTILGLFLKIARFLIILAIIGLLIAWAAGGLSSLQEAPPPPATTTL